jgi:hypothetical protein
VRHKKTKITSQIIPIICSYNNILNLWYKDKTKNPNKKNIGTFFKKYLKPVNYNVHKTIL